MSTCLVYNNGYSLKDHIQKRCFILLLVMASADWIHCDVQIDGRLFFQWAPSKLEISTNEVGLGEGRSINIINIINWMNNSGILNW